STGFTQTSGTNFAGDGTNGAHEYASSNRVYNDGTNAGWFKYPGNWQQTPTQTSKLPPFLDPTEGKSQPPIVANSALPTCGIGKGRINGTYTLGPYQYYAVDSSGVNRRATGDPITVSGNVTFAANGGCPSGLSSGTPSPLSTQFPAYLFYGGM